MKKLLFVAASLFCMAAVSCRKAADVTDGTLPDGQPDSPVEGLVKMSFSADAEQTRATLDGKRVVWQMTDHIAVYDGEARRDFSVTSVNGDVAVIEGYVAAGATAFTAVYPYSAASQTLPSEEGAIQLNYPEVQTLAGSAIAPEALVAVAVADAENNFSFKNVSSLLKLSLSDSDVTSVILKGHAGEKIAGATTCGADGSSSAGSAASVMLKPAGTVFAPGDYYLGLLPATFTDGFTVSFTKASAKAFARTEKEVAFPVNGGKDITASTASLDWFAIPIMTEADLRKFAQHSELFGPEELVKVGADITLTQAWTPFPLYCQFDGQNHSISGLEVTAQNRAGFVSVLDTDASLMNLEISGSITLTGTGSLSYAGLVAEADGSLYKVTNRTAVTLADGATCQAYVGGLAGCLGTGGSISSSHNAGPVVLGGASKDVSFVGGVVGYMTSGAGSVAHTPNDGAVSCSNTNGQGIGGIAGMVQGGGITSSDNNAQVSVTASRSGNSFVAGIAGFVQNRSGRTLAVSSCVNKGEIDVQTTTIKGVGGVVAQLHQFQNGNTNVTDCQNTRDIDVAVALGSERALAGIVANTSNTENNFSNTISGCRNTGALSFSGACTDQSNQTLVGGIVAAAHRDTRVESCVNTGAVSSDWHSINSVSGIVGRAGGVASVSNCTNEADVTLNLAFVSTAEVWQGGAAGIVAYYTSSGDITGNTNKGNVQMSLKAGSPTVQAGGVIALAQPGGTPTVSGNVNRGSVLIKTSNIQNAAGGIIGQVKAGLNTRANYNFGAITMASMNADGTPKTYEGDNYGFVGGVIGGFCLSNAACTMTDDRNLGTIVAPGRAAGIFAVARYDCAKLSLTLSGCKVGYTLTGYLNATPSATIVAGYKRGLAATEKYAPGMIFSYYKSGTDYTTLSQSGSGYITAADAEAELAARP